MQEINICTVGVAGTTGVTEMVRDIIQHNKRYILNDTHYNLIPYISEWKEPIVIHKNKSDTHFSLKSKILKVYRDNELTITPAQINKDVQECMVHKRTHIYI